MTTGVWLPVAVPVLGSGMMISAFIHYEQCRQDNAVLLGDRLGSAPEEAVQRVE
jgi:hypothetical protein